MHDRSVIGDLNFDETYKYHEDFVFWLTISKNHNIFYTTITRAKKNLMIYWTPESANKIVSKFKNRFSIKDTQILKVKNGTL